MTDIRRRMLMITGGVLPLGMVGAASAQEQAGQARAAAAPSSVADLYGSIHFDDVAGVQADTTLTYDAALPGSVKAGNIVHARVGNFNYVVDPDGPIATAGGVRLSLAKADGINVVALGADYTGSRDSTAAFSLAATLGKKIIVPAGTYLVSDIALQPGSEWIGEARSAVTLLVSANDTAAFFHAGTELHMPNIRIRNMTVAAAPGVTGARGIRQGANLSYLSYATIENVEFFKSLRTSLDVLPIFLACRDVRDGYSGNSPPAQPHNFMTAKFSGKSSNTPNFNAFQSCQFFGSGDTEAVFDLEFGWSFSFDQCDFEQNDTRIAKLVSVRGVVFRNCWMEGNGSKIYPDYFLCQDSRIRGAIGTTLWIEDTIVDFLNKPGVVRFVNSIGASRWGVSRLDFRRGADGVKLGRGDVGEAGKPSLGAQNLAVQGMKDSGFLAEFVEPAQVVRDVEATPLAVCWPPCELLAVDQLATNLSVATSGSIAAAPTDVISLTRPGSSLRITTGDGYTIAYYTIPDKLVAALRGKTVTLTIAGSWLVASGAAYMEPSAWQDGAPVASSTPTFTATTGIIASTGTTYQLHSITFAVGAAAAALHVGIRCGPGAPNAQFQLERLSLFRGQARPDVI